MRYVESQTNGKPNNLNVLGANKLKKIDNSRYNVPMPERDEPDQISMKQI
jgi:hypothetical protein